MLAVVGDGAASPEADAEAAPVGAVVSVRPVTATMTLPTATSSAPITTARCLFVALGGRRSDSECIEASRAICAARSADDAGRGEMRSRTTSSASISASAFW